MTKHKKYKNGDRFIPAAEFWNRMIKQGKVSHFKEGGEFNGLKQYNAPKHEQGGQNIDVNGNPTMMNPKGQVEGTENKIKYFNLPDKTGQEYIFSDANKTSLELKKFMKKFKKNHDPDNDDLSRNMMELKAKDLEFKNEAINASKQQENIPQQFNFGGGFNPILGMAFDVFKNNVINDGKEISDMSRFDYNQNNNLQPRPDIVNIPDKLPQISPFNKIPGTGNIPDKLPQLNPLNFNAVPDVPVLNNNSNVSDNTSNPNISMPEISNEQLLSGIGYGIKGVQAFSPATKENLMLPDFSKSDEKFGAMNANLDTARNEALSASNLMSNLNRSSVSNFNQYKNAQSQNFSNLQKNLGNIGLNEQQLRNAVLGQQGQYEQGKIYRIKLEQEIKELDLQMIL
jgi:hypothetical protein